VRIRLQDIEDDVAVAMEMCGSKRAHEESASVSGSSQKENDPVVVH